MDTIMSDHLSKLEFGELMQFENMTVIPLFTSINDSPSYLTLKEALERKVLTIMEVSDSGSVPELKVINEADIPVLILDGEELIGAKQNRTLNTTILLKEKSETIIPVSCTEQGRWSYTSREFYDSDMAASPAFRAKKASSVSANLKDFQTFRSDQGEIWDEIDKMSIQYKVQSPTRAMRDVYSSRLKELDDYLQAFKYLDNQKGLIVFINGKISGLDIVSLASAYKILHPKLVKSYALEALIMNNKETDDSLVNIARFFLEETKTCEEEKYSSIGHGWDFRYKGRYIVGSSLVHEDKVIHSAFFRVSESDQTGKMAGFRRRSSFRV